jgi:hypothetical protein
MCTVEFYYRILLLERDELLKCYEQERGNMKCKRNEVHKMWLGYICLNREGMYLKHTRQ